MTYRDLVLQVLEELGANGQGVTASPGDVQTALTRVNRVVDGWNAQREAIYSETLVTNPVTPGLQPHTIGPTGTWVVASRPVSIEQATYIHGTSRDGLSIRPASWYTSRPDQVTRSTVPSDLYYNPAWPNGELYLFPIAAAADTIELLVRVVLSSAALLDDTLSMPPGYLGALVLTSAEECFSAFGTPTETRPLIIARAREARARIFAANTPTPNQATRDVGVPGGRTWFDFRTGLVR